QIALNNRPEIEIVKQGINLSKSEMDLARHELLPSLNATVSYEMRGIDKHYSDAVESLNPHDRDSWTVGLEFNYPFGNNAADARYKEKKEAYNQALTEVERAEKIVITQVEVALLAVKLAQDEIESTSKSLASARRVIEGEKAQFELGKVSNVELLRAQDLLIAAERNHFRAIISYNIALIESARAQGIVLSELGVAIDANRNH
ncbi:unnamed protein product, partial [marine sediment metagenome]